MQTRDENVFYSIAITRNLRILVGHGSLAEGRAQCELHPASFSSCCCVYIYLFDVEIWEIFFKKTSKHHVLTQTTSSPPFFLRDSRASETRARVKITPHKKGDTRPRRVSASLNQYKSKSFSEMMPDGVTFTPSMRTQTFLRSSLLFTREKLSSYKLIVSKQSQDKTRGKKRRVAKVMLMKR